MKTDIEWTDDGVSKKYPRKQALVLMAANLGTLWKPCAPEYSRLRKMTPGGHVRMIDFEGGQFLPDCEYRCVGCQTCYPDAPDETECPGCGRPLDPYPHYYLAPKASDALFFRADKADKVTVVSPDGESPSEVFAPDRNTDQMFDNCFDRITEQDAHKLLGGVQGEQMNENQIRDKVLEQIRGERERQINSKNYDTEHDDNHTRCDWMAIVSHEVGCLADCVLNRDRSAYVAALKKVAAVCVAAIENEYRKGESNEN